MSASPSGVICRRSRETLGTVLLPRQCLLPKAFIPQVRTDLFHSFGGQPFFGSAPKNLSKKQKGLKFSKQDEKLAQPLPQIFAPILDIFLLSMGGGRGENLKPYWKHGLKI